MDVIRAHPSRVALVLLAVATAIGSTGLAAGGTAGALIATEITGSAAWAGVPLGISVAGSAAGAVVISRRTQRVGRASGLVLGYGVGAAGAAIVIAGAAIGNLVAVLAGSAALGTANAAVFLGRYAAADLAGEAGRGGFLGIVLAGAALGAVVSPNLLGPSGELATYAGLPRLAGLYLVAIPAFWVAGAIVALIPGGSVKARRADPAVGGAAWEYVRGAEVKLALVILASTNLVMVATMAVAPVHLTGHGHDLEYVGVATSIHVLCMFAPSPLSGWLADRLGGGAVALAGAFLLVVAGLAAAVADARSSVAIVIALAILGLGWNAGVVGGSTMLTAASPAAVRPQIEGIGELAMGFAAGAGAPLAGLVVTFRGFGVLAAAGAAVSTLALVVLRVSRRIGGVEEASDAQPSVAYHGTMRN